MESTTRTPEGFIFAVKVPQVVTHEKALVDCDAEFEEFVKTMDILGPKLGPMVFQFPLFDRWKYPKQESFLAVLAPFLKKLPADHKFVVEVRNKNWLNDKFADALRVYNVALALTDTSFVPRPWEMNEKFDPITADFTYVRWLHDDAAAITEGIAQRRDESRARIALVGRQEFEMLGRCAGLPLHVYAPLERNLIVRTHPCKPGDRRVHGLKIHKVKRVLQLPQLVAKSGPYHGFPACSRSLDSTATPPGNICRASRPTFRPWSMID